jgi:hypothetical protein
MLGTSRAISGGGQGGNQLPPHPCPPPGQHGTNDEPERPKKEGYVDFFRRGLRNLGRDIPINQELAMLLPTRN